jgi:tetratricopeptide (TPR) repeat protein
MTLHLSRVLEECRPRIAIMTGICAGDARQVQLGDLVVAERTFTYDNGKFTLDEQGRSVHQHDTLTYQLDANILQFLGLFDDWKPLVAGLQRPSSSREPRETACHLKAMASGSAVRADNPFEDVRAPVRGTVAIDMEGAAFGLVMSRHPLIPWLVVKGVCDYADRTKSDAYHDYAAHASALYALSFIRAYVTNERLPQPDGLSNRTEPSGIWTVPYPRNPLFTGREAELQAIAGALWAGQNAAIGQAISGLGGIGKTQTALEYAYRHRNEYRHVFWAIAETRDTLNIAYSRFAELLDLPGKNLAEQHLIVEAVKRWLATHNGWLLILDNADDLALLPDYLPSSIPGHLLLTTRAHAMGGLAQRVEIKQLDQEEGSRFLLRRSVLLGKNDPIEQADPSDLAQAREIVRELAGLPLALDQAGAYIEETSCGLQTYLDLYRAHHADLLSARGGLLNDHPEPVATTWQLSFARVEQANLAAADLLRLCAFLASDNIPEILLTGGASQLTPALQELASNPLKLNAAIAELLKYSLIGRTPAKKTLDVHRLVQVALREAMTSDGERVWAERTVRAVKQVFPWPEVKTWEMCRQLLAHGQACAALIEQWQMELVEGAHLLNSVGVYLAARGDYQEAQEYLEKAVVLSRNTVGDEHPGTAMTLHNLANIYRNQGKHDQAMVLHKQAYTIWRKILGEHHPDIAMSLHSQAIVYADQGEYDQAVVLYKQALAIRRKVLGEDHPETAATLNNLATVYHAQGNFEEALNTQNQALAIQRHVLDEHHPEIAASLHGLALTHQEQAHYAVAESLYKQALAIYSETLGESHPDTARCLANLGGLYRTQKRYQEAVPLFEKALLIRQEKLGSEHPATKGTQRSYDEMLQLMEGKSKE